MDKRSSKTILKIYRGFALALEEKSYTAVTSLDIIRSAGISPSGFYAHFKSKRDVLQGLLAKLFLTVKIKNGFALESHLTLLFFRIDNDKELWQRIVSKKENAIALGSFLIPWCMSFLPKANGKETAKLASSLLSDALLLYMKGSDKTAEEMSKLLVAPLSALLSA